MSMFRYGSLPSICPSVVATMLGFALLMVPVGSQAQSGGPDSFGYSYSAAPFDWVDLALTGNPLFLGDDDEVNVFLPWSFSFYGVGYSVITVGSNGGIRFRTSSVTTATIGTGNTCLPATSSSAPDLAVLWDDLNPSAGGDVYWLHDTSTPSDRFIVSWEGVPHFSTSGVASFQVHLLASGLIQYHWLDTDFSSAFIDDGISATIGIQDYSGSVGGAALDPIEVSCDTASTLELTAVSFSTCDDIDADGFSDVSCGGDDCDDSDSTINPAALDICGNGVRPQLILCGVQAKRLRKKNKVNKVKRVVGRPLMLVEHLLESRHINVERL